MQCPKCKSTYLEVFGSFCGSQKIEFTCDGMEVVDSNPTDFEWDDDNTVICLECSHEGSAVNFKEVPHETAVEYPLQ